MACDWSGKSVPQWLRDDLRRRRDFHQAREDELGDEARAVVVELDMGVVHARDGAQKIMDALFEVGARGILVTDILACRL